ncbi:hypothetical protein T11_17009 [Trichinella zimbabwensis]|uniref:Uncharacterized protein n=1 Tax=Trichinella zimbabwensis TaxID=268475 RepID=A0A0V1GIG4_9BILA|nr:hypothetical protein T11_17009 [Trichinella zimbabwensis]
MEFVGIFEECCYDTEEKEERAVTEQGKKWDLIQSSCPGIYLER